MIEVRKIDFFVETIEVQNHFQKSETLKWVINGIICYFKTFL